MREQRIIKYLMRFKGITQKEIAEELGYSNQSGVSGLLGRERMKVEDAVILLGMMGYDIVVVDRPTGKRVAKITLKDDNEIEFPVSRGRGRPRKAGTRGLDVPKGIKKRGRPVKTRPRVEYKEEENVREEKGGIPVYEYGKKQKGYHERG